MMVSCFFVECIHLIWSFSICKSCQLSKLFSAWNWGVHSFVSWNLDNHRDSFYETSLWSLMLANLVYMMCNWHYWVGSVALTSSLSTRKDQTQHSGEWGWWFPLPKKGVSESTGGCSVDVGLMKCHMNSSSSSSSECQLSVRWVLWQHAWQQKRYIVLGENPTCYNFKLRWWP